MKIMIAVKRLMPEGMCRSIVRKTITPATSAMRYQAGLEYVVAATKLSPGISGRSWPVGVALSAVGVISVHPPRSGQRDGTAKPICRI
jgi:hypothetical protein